MGHKVMRVDNKKARFDYEIEGTVEAGIVLTGGEAKAARLGHVSMDGSHVRIIDGEVWVVNMKISPYQFASNPEYDPGRNRKLLLARKEIEQLVVRASQKRLTLVPVAVYTRGPKIKVEVGLARGKREYEKREQIKKKDVQRDIEREIK